MKLPKVLKAEWPGDLKCPYCSEGLEWDNDHLFSFSFELVQCSWCERIFQAKRMETVSYEILK